MSVLFAGFNDQLGLKLVPGKEMVDLLVIDSVNRTPAVAGAWTNGFCFIGCWIARGESAVPVLRFT